MKKIVIYITVFLCGAIIMALELVAARVMSPYVGSSNPIWTSIIGVILISMSLGYWLGGKMADHRTESDVLATFILVSSVTVSLIPIIETLLIKPMALTGLPLAVVAVLSALIAFAVPSALLATVSPYAIKLMETDSGNVGSISGRLSAISTLGSIFGTFFTGFCLIPLLGNRMIVLLSSILLAALGLVLFFNKSKKHIIVALVCVALSICNVSLGAVIFRIDNPSVLADTDSEYSRIWVTRQGDYKILQVDRAIESYLKEDGSMGSYLNYYDLFNCYIPDAQNAMIIGGAAYTYPMSFLNKYDDKTIDVVEIDPAMTSLAEKYFGLKKDSGLNIYHRDGRSFVNKTEKKYDAIFVDAFKGHNVPFELTTVEAFEKMRNSLTDKGVVMVNVISSLEGENSGFIKHEFATFNEVFECVKIFDVSADSDSEPTDIRNLILMGFNFIPSNENVMGDEEMLDDEVINYRSDKKAFTDDYAPVEKYCV